MREAWEGEPAAPVIMLTGQDDYAVDLQATELGVTDYLVKGSIDAPSLERTIRYAVRHHRAMVDLRRSEERYAVAVRATNDGIWDWDLTTRSDALLRALEDAVGVRGPSPGTSPTRGSSSCTPTM